MFSVVPLLLTFLLLSSCLLSDAATEGKGKDGRHSGRTVRSPQLSPLIVEPTSHGKISSNDKEAIMVDVWIFFWFQASFEIVRLLSHSAALFSSDILSVVCFFYFCLPVEEVAGRSSGRVSALSDAPSDGLQTAFARSRPSSPDPLESALTEMFISERRINKMENVLDTWSNNLKVGLLSVIFQIICNYKNG